MTTCSIFVRSKSPRRGIYQLKSMFSYLTWKYYITYNKITEETLILATLTTNVNSFPCCIGSNVARKIANINTRCVNELNYT